MANNFKKGIDRQMWVFSALAPNIGAAGRSMCSDLRSDISRNPYIYQLVSNTVLDRYNIITKAWNNVGSPALGGTFGAGSAVVFTPSKGTTGNIGSGASTTIIPTTTVITAIGVNMLANRGGSGEYGFKIRVIGLTSGKTEERFIVSNTAGTTPTFVLDNPLTFTPASGDIYELLSGGVYMLNAGAIVAGTSFRNFNVATNLFSNAGTTGLPTIGTDSTIIALDEQYTPYDCEPGEGFIKGGYKYDENLVSRFALTATATASGTLTGQASGGDSSVLENEYRNFQIRVIEDTTNPTAVGQRRIIASHTAGASPVYTLGSNWSVTPSSTAKYVIEYPNLLILRTTANTTTYTYNYNSFTINNGTNTISADTWSTTYFGVAPAAHTSAALLVPSFGIRPDEQKNSRHSFIYYFRGGNTSTLDLLDISAAATGTWSSTIVYDGAIPIPGGACGSYSPFGNDGRFYYLNAYNPNVYNQIYRFDVKNRVMSPYTPTDWIQTVAAATGGRMATYCAFNGNEKYDIVFLQTMGSTITQELIVQV
jgi:hypothetical protein